jgi:ParB family transcriptional regulator, chromosome partitioning protein
MVTRRSGLGRGLDSLIPSGPGPGSLHHLPLDLITPNPDQPRTRFDEDTIQALAASIAEVGVLQPVVVRPGAEGGYVLIAGERRWRAAQVAGLREIPALLRTSDERSALAEAVVENLQREDLTPLEEAAAYTQLLEDFAMTHEQVGALVGKSRAAVTNTLRLLSLPPVIQGMLERGELSAGHARALVGLDDERFAEHVARRAVDEGWSVRRIEEAVRARRGAATAPAAIRELRPPALFELEQRLAEQLGAKVEIQYRNDRGRLVIHYGSVAELERLYRRLLG